MSADLLNEVGFDSFNTNLLADRADLSVRAIYRYFPNKYAIVIALAEALNAASREWVGDLSRLDQAEDWKLALSSAIENYFIAAKQYKGFAALRITAQAVPELRSIDDRDNSMLQLELIAGLRRLGVRLPRARLNALSLVTIRSSDRILDLALQSPPREARILVDELKRMIVGYLSPYLEGTSQRGLAP
ncbi:MAG TPA: TetR/AcrR family transcriptional regulator [Rhizomicrobium sp.]|nr:TetR/AcrR family transcriptional regulator [Rhizomicrobium sp.]